MTRRDERLRLHALSEGSGDLDRLAAWCERVLAAGVTSLRLREPSLGLDGVLRACELLRPRCAAAGALLLVTEQVRAVLDGLADGLQIGARTPDAQEVRECIGNDAWLGYSAHDPQQLALAAACRCDFALLSPVWPTRSKPAVAPLGVERAAQWTAAATLPVLWLGGVGPETAKLLAAVPAPGRPYGLAAIGAFAAPGSATTCDGLREALR